MTATELKTLVDLDHQVDADMERMGPDRLMAYRTLLLRYVSEALGALPGEACRSAAGTGGRPFAPKGRGPGPAPLAA
jgi:hypothetical protein